MVRGTGGSENWCKGRLVVVKNSGREDLWQRGLVAGRTGSRED